MPSNGIMAEVKKLRDNILTTLNRKDKPMTDNKLAILMDEMYTLLTENVEATDNNGNLINWKAIVADCLRLTRDSINDITSESSSVAYHADWFGREIVNRVEEKRNLEKLNNLTKKGS